MPNSTFPASLLSDQPACSNDDAAPLSFGQGEARQAQHPLRSIRRPDALSAQHVEVGIVLNAMLGREAANDYLVRHAIGDDVIARVLDPLGRRRGRHDESGVRI